ncbi:uncharacterized protein LOC133303173 [Gastrolobium bilobum]|uniref:uncharacterized protein LOC133303173 n=1 Tax=Gastrolobium bilobum TaxID=150636 RepID=UPI002AB287E6|nr:uncharacterized protein LOC133303173 [Gastrolobium bilobum]
MILKQTTGQNRVFGTARNTNITGKSVTDKCIIKTKIAVPRRQPKCIIDTSAKTQATDEKSPENVNPRLNKKNETFPQRKAEKTLKNSQDKDSVEPKTPVASTNVRTKSKVPPTPFYTAVHCSKCRFDRLETSSYWISQIKMAESVGKHFVASDFFRLALESQAEPSRNLRNELRRYLLRHGHLSEQKEWREVAARYGLLKVESNTSRMDSSNLSSNMCGKNESDRGDVPGKLPEE